MGLPGIGDPLASGCHASHNVLPVIDFPDLRQAAVAPQDVAEFLDGGTSPGAVGQYNPARLRNADQLFKGPHRNEMVFLIPAELFENGCSLRVGTVRRCALPNSIGLSNRQMLVHR